MTIFFHTPMLFMGTPQIVLIVLLVLILFGGKKIPELMKGLGKGVRGFKDGINGIDDEEDGDTKSSTKK